MKNYRNKSTFGLNDYVHDNIISSLISIKITNFVIDFKNVNNLTYMKDITIRNDDYQVLIKIDFMNYNIINNIIKTSLVNEMTEFVEKNNYILKSIFVQFHNKSMNKHNKLIKLYGCDNIIFNLKEKQYCIGPLNYFQTNYHEIDNLYKYVHSLCNNININNIILVGVDSGNLAVYFKNVKVYIPCKYSYEAAISNNKLNNLDNSIYHINNNYSDINILEDCIVVINPTRKGISNENICFLNKCKYIKYLIYMSCNPIILEKNISHLEFKILSSKNFDIFYNVKNYNENIVLLRKI